MTDNENLSVGFYEFENLARPLSLGSTTEKNASMQISLLAKNKYGKLHYYPACYLSHMLCAFHNSVTISLGRQKVLKGFGVVVNIEYEKEGKGDRKYRK